MGTVVRAIGALGFVLFVGVLALRPFLANPALAGVLRDGPGGWRLLAVLPLVVVTLLVIALRLRSSSGGANSPDTRQSDPGRPESFWNRRPSDGAGVDPGDPSSGATGTDNTRIAETHQADTTDQKSGEPAGLLGGQGGTRDREFEIEEKPPDATLREHLEHLQAELDDDKTAAGDLQTLEAVARETGDEQAIPARCPQDHCDAVWTGRTVLGVRSGRYEPLDDGRRVQCLHCEEIHTLE